MDVTLAFFIESILDFVSLLVAMQHKPCNEPKACQEEYQSYNKLQPQKRDWGLQDAEKHISHQFDAKCCQSTRYQHDNQCNDPYHYGHNSFLSHY